MTNNPQDNTGVIAPPPLIYAAGLVIGLLLQRTFTLRFLPKGWGRAVLVYTGIAVLANALWAMLLLPIALLIMRFGVIGREERYLERKFGEQYLSYKSQVRRWI